MPHDSPLHHHRALPEMKSDSERLSPAAASKITARIAALSVATALVLIIIKGFAYGLSGSVGMLSALVDSGLDLAASLFTFFAVRYAAVPADDDHRFGHGKAEAFAGLFQSGLVVISGVLVFIEAVSHLQRPTPINEGGVGLIVMVVSLLLTGVLVFAQSRAIKLTQSVATKGDMAHYLTDFATNGVVLVGLGFSTFLGWHWFDAVAAIIVALWLLWGARGIAMEAADHLMDREMPDADRTRIEAIAAEDPRLANIHDLRTRMSGPYVHIQFHAELPPETTIHAAHLIILDAERRIMNVYPHADIIIHIDPAGHAEPHGLFEKGPGVAKVAAK